MFCVAGGTTEDENKFMNLQLLSEWGVFENADAIAEISTQASGESSLEIMLKHVRIST